MKSLKFNANELLDSLNREMNQDEINEIYKAIIAYGLGLEEITKEIEHEVLDDAIAYYFDNDRIAGIINEDVMQYAKERLIWCD